jgi:CRISPR-associated endonuclease Cas3-HD
VCRIYFLLTKYMEEFIAKSDGTTLLHHSRQVVDCSIEIYTRTVESAKEDDMEIIRLAALLHDVGKACLIPQERIKANKSLNSGDVFPHNEIGWAFLSAYLNIKESDLDDIANCVFWHHALKYNKKIGYVTNSKILESLTNQDLENMFLFAEQVITKDLLHQKDYCFNIKHSPSYFTRSHMKKSQLTIEDRNEKSTFIRSCVISADRMVSNLCQINDLEQ